VSQGHPDNIGSDGSSTPKKTQILKKQQVSVEKDNVDKDNPKAEEDNNKDNNIDIKDHFSGVVIANCIPKEACQLCCS
jgi:hypothetical protein